ncbi:pancreatic secretory granule membrane major glycoprotein GP2-like [Trachinotus anak]|uniref:pancreatic secretory granule membrane major glycoprotein GP2-like n=1 Tax=Trachinotus anak TaxID=443729 RepID=UPI0039F24094
MLFILFYLAALSQTADCSNHKSTCTLIGSTVIGFGDNVTTVSDRCGYTLMSHGGVHIVAVFQERRRKDVSFLEQMILHLDGERTNIHLKQGGRVQLNNTELSLNSSLQLPGVELSKDRTGVTARLISFNASVFFNGYTAQIHMTNESDVQGLCGNGTVSDLVLSKHSSRSCALKYPEIPDPTINCTIVTESCSILLEAPFTTCHQYVNPAPFISACIRTLCQYPAVDGLSRCQFLEAYTRACSLQGNVTLQGWRSNVSCSAPQIYCPDTLCSPHEFCALHINGETSCFCRAIFASTYRSRDALGDPTVCHLGSASLTLVGCLLEERGIDYTMLHLNDTSCRGHKDNRTHMVTFSFDSSNTCGTVVMANNSQIIHKNSIRIQNLTGVITRRDQVQIDFSCYYTQPDIKSMSFRIRDSSVIKQIVSGVWNYTLTMKAYSDAARTQAIVSSTEIRLQQTVWVELKTKELDGKQVALVTDSCWATDQPSPNGSLRYDLVMRGCANPADGTVRVMDNGLGTSNYFSFNMFQFTGRSGDVYLHCRLNLCVKSSGTCAPSCGARRRRSARPKYEDENPAFITMAWTN